MNYDLTILLKRTPLNTPIETVLKQVEAEYPSVGLIQNITPINEGYEDANIILHATNGKYVIKIFLAERTTRAVKDYVRVMVDASQVGVPTLELMKGKQGYLSKVITEDSGTTFIITKYFESTNFQFNTPSLAEMLMITGYIAKLNTLSYSVEETYDSWGNKNLVHEFETNRRLLTPLQLELITPVVDETRQLNLNEFSQAIIHGDMQRKHVLKNDTGELRIIDFGCMSYGPKVIDLSTLLAWFCLNDEESWKYKDKIYNAVVAEYLKVHPLNSQEIASLKPLIRAAYAAYYQKTSILVNEGDNSQETQNWHSQSNMMLMLASSWH